MREELKPVIEAQTREVISKEFDLKFEQEKAVWEAKVAELQK